VKVRVILVDGHTLVREGLRLLLDKEPDIEVVGEAEDGREALKVVRATKHDVVVMEVRMPRLNGIEATRQILAASPKTKVVALSANSENRDVDGMLRAGARGFVIKESTSQELLQAVRAAARGDAYLSPSITARYVGEVNS
jgi:two-component system, NarL family, response regulator LiaR